MTRATINISDEDFGTVVSAAYTAKSKGDAEGAAKLDKLARKMNAALTTRANPRHPYAPPTKSLRWQDVPSVFALSGK